jgi:hypothetical protein
MRRRLRPLAGRSMARRSGDTGSDALSPRALRYAGWIVAALFIIGIAVVVGVLGDQGDEGEVGGASPSASGSLGGTIEFGMALDPETGQVAEEARTDRFAAGDTFVYSVPPSGTIPDAVYVEVVRTSTPEPETAQAPVDADPLPNPEVIAFTVPADDLLAVFGPGDYVMRIYADPESEPLAEGTFHLVDSEESPSPSA